MTKQSLTAQQMIVHDRLQNDLEYFCRKALVIKLKEGGTAPFHWNKAQRYLHDRIEAQIRRTGMVRLYIIKGRQQGISTYIAARLYHHVTRRKGRNTFILSHQANTTETLFQIVERYHENCPPEITQEIDINNNRRLRFKNGSQYTVGTAGSGSIGRGDTNQYFHGSEVGFYENTDDIKTGVFQTVADVEGTEKFLESTANGIGNWFHEGCMQALSGGDAYELVFIPWYWQDEYRAALPPDFDLTDEEQYLKETYSLDNQQVQWRRNKLRELKSERLFKQEYPFTVEEAFQSSGNSLIDSAKVARARKSSITDDNAPLILGVDPARTGDRTVIAWRRGRHWIKNDIYHEMDEMLLAGKLALAIKREGVKKVFIDVALGYGTVDRLHELGFGKIVKGINFSHKPSEDIYLNKRAEMALRLRDWIHEDGKRVPDCEETAVDLASIPDFKVTSSGKIQIVAKEEIKKTLKKSPDVFDAGMLTFAEEVSSDLQDEIREENMRRRKQKKGGSPLRTRNRVAKNEESVYDDEDEYTYKRNSKIDKRRR